MPRPGPHALGLLSGSGWLAGSSPGSGWLFPWLRLALGPAARLRSLVLRTADGSRGSFPGSVRVTVSCPASAGRCDALGLTWAGSGSLAGSGWGSRGRALTLCGMTTGRQFILGYSPSLYDILSLFFKIPPQTIQRDQRKAFGLSIRRIAMSKAQKGNKENKKPKADKNQHKANVSAYKAAQGQGKPASSPFAKKT